MKFTVADFRPIIGTTVDDVMVHTLVNLANTRLSEFEKQIREDERKKILDGAPVVYGTAPYSVWDCEKGRNDTHTAKLVDIRPIEEGKSE